MKIIDMSFDIETFYAEMTPYQKRMGIMTLINAINDDKETGPYSLWSVLSNVDAVLSELNKLKVTNDSEIDIKMLETLKTMKDECSVYWKVNLTTTDQSLIYRLPYVFISELPDSRPNFGKMLLTPEDNIHSLTYGDGIKYFLIPINDSSYALRDNDGIQERILYDQPQHLVGKFYFINGMLFNSMSTFAYILNKAIRGEI